jgi:hypothetical protein
VINLVRGSHKRTSLLARLVDDAFLLHVTSLDVNADLPCHHSNCLLSRRKGAVVSRCPLAGYEITMWRS